MCWLLLWIGRLLFIVLVLLVLLFIVLVLLVLLCVLWFGWVLCGMWSAVPIVCCVCVLPVLQRLPADVVCVCCHWALLLLLLVVAVA